MNEKIIRKIDLSQINELQKLVANFNIKLRIEDLENKNSYYIGCIINNSLVAFLNYCVYYERAEVNYIFVMSEYRRNNIATEMLQYMLVNINNLDNVTLEVRQNNFAAIELYKKIGFKECAIRKNYYGKEDAILMLKELGDSYE
ncbi:MAG: GNAT family N-acetyltransferase [Bacilli bacterium]|nr:GNAT family N-acetyltransferase [Bacilli bacterium]MCI9434000.1 GNAT family N-acetyltransferase [Bacilli bacterium]